VREFTDCEASRAAKPWCWGRTKQAEAVAVRNLRPPHRAMSPPRAALHEGSSCWGTRNPKTVSGTLPASGALLAPRHQRLQKSPFLIDQIKPHDRPSPTVNHEHSNFLRN